MENVVSPLTIEQFYKFIGEKKLMAAECKHCGLKIIPPKPICPKCDSREMGWTEIKTRGKLITYTVIYVAPEEFQHLAPYVYGIVELEDGPRLPGIIKGLPNNDAEIGMELEVEFETTAPATWPQWPRYYFRPVKSKGEQ
ncbi:MAG: Zn-ribbon domain-containing OB-fold protein [Nitrososphaerota archaeon]|nr:Zn-ribbon domain-containing OB-fold protein [Candidatus Bathyarchaeota archaeon]MDW8049063.1 Zn-ribbon domain-containing OB-fold protein [Nitrososphaerota archaeon]